MKNSRPYYVTPAQLRDVWEVPDAAVQPVLWFWDHGIGVFPLKSRSKEPACASWDDFTCSREQAGRFLNYGVPLSATLGVLDTDCPEAELWVLQQIAGGAIPETPFVVTTARGKHRYFRLAGPLPKSLHRSGHTLEFRNAGQYVVGPGSVHPSGVTYRASDWSWRWDDIPLFPADFLFDDGSCGHRSVPGSDYVFPDEVRAGERHHELFRLLRSWKSCWTRDDAREGIHLMNLAHCRPPLEEDETFERWFTRGWNQPDRPFPCVAPLQGLDEIGGL